MRKISPWVCAIAVLAVIPAFGAAKAKKQSAIQNGTSVRTKVEAKGIYSQECYDAYYGCMDQFCITENSNGGSCACSDKNAKYEADLENIQKILQEAERIKTEEVERVELGSKADIVFGGKREYDEDGNVVYENNKKNKKKDLLAMFETKTEDDDDEDESELDGKVGAELFSAVHNLCVEQIEEDCEKDFTFLKKLYQRQIDSDCKAFENSVAKQKAAADVAMANAKADVRSALKESFEEANKYNQGECMVEFKKCMQKDDACGADWENCVSFAATEEISKGSSKKKFVAESMFNISDSVMELLSAKRAICERVLDSCMAVRDNVWTAFLREAAPTLKLAESKSESKQRQSCLTKISKCIQTACKDDIEGKGVATMDACLARPDMARSFCKVELDSCERVDKSIWSYVESKLAAMRVDACTDEVKTCFTDDTRCGPNFQNCIGMDYQFIRTMCPLEKLVVCKQEKKDFSMDDIDKYLSGLYLNIDNAALDNCQALVSKKMIDVCGSEFDCNRFAADGNIGTGSLSSQKSGNVYRIEGMISFGSILMGNASGSVKDGEKTLKPGEIGVQAYIAKVLDNNKTGGKNDGIVERIESELNNIAGNINRVIDLIEQDPKIQYCVSGRSLEQITGEKDKNTAPRFKHLLDGIKMQIANAALGKARENYEAKYNELVSKATKDLDADIAQYLCQKMADDGSMTLDKTAVNTEVDKPYAISYEIGAGLSNDILMKGGHSKTSLGETKIQRTKKKSMTTSNGMRESYAVFDRENRICHLCTTTITNSCSNLYKGWGGKAESNCVQSEPMENCKDLSM